MDNLQESSHVKAMALDGLQIGKGLSKVLN